VDPLFLANILRQALQSRLQRVLDDLNHNIYDIKTLLEIAASTTRIEKSMTIEYKIPHPLYAFKEGDLKCRFRDCHQEKGINRSFNFNVHLKRFHPCLQPFLDSTICSVCDEDLESAQALIHHERTRHGAHYKSRPEIFAPCFHEFQGVPLNSCSME
jgi:hypothetical protein